MPEFGHAVAMSFEANLAYSVLFKLGKLTDGAVGRWVEGERLRIVAALAETQQFDRGAFEKTLHRIKTLYGAGISGVNKATLVWAISALFLAAFLVVILPFSHGNEVKSTTAEIYFVLLFGAVPIGICLNILIHIVSRCHMSLSTQSFNTVIRYLSNAAAEQTERARTALNDRRGAE